MSNPAAALDLAKLAAISGTEWHYVQPMGDRTAYVWTLFPLNRRHDAHDLIAAVSFDGNAWDDMLADGAKEDGVPFTPGQWPWTLYYTNATPDGTPTPEETWDAWAHSDDPYGFADEARYMSEGGVNADTTPPSPAADIPPADWVEGDPEGGWGAFRVWAGERTVPSLAARFHTEDEAADWADGEIADNQSVGFRIGRVNPDGTPDGWNPGTIGRSHH